MFGKLGPLAVAGEAAIGADRADDRVARDRGVLDSLDEIVEGHAGVLEAAGGEAESVGVAIDCGMVGEAEFVADIVETAPDEEVELDFGAAWVFANAALTGVAE